MLHTLILSLFISAPVFANQISVQLNAEDIQNLDPSPKYWQSSLYDQNLKTALYKKEVSLEEIEINDTLKSMAKEIEDDASDEKRIAKAATFEVIRRNWENNLAFTILNEVNANSFLQFVPFLRNKLQNESQYIGRHIDRNEGKMIYIFQMADIGKAHVYSDRTRARVEIEFNTNNKRKHSQKRQK